MKTLDENDEKFKKEAKAYAATNYNGSEVAEWCYYYGCINGYASQFREPSTPETRITITVEQLKESGVVPSTEQSGGTEQEERIKVLEEALREIIDYQINFVELACTTTVYKIANKALHP